MTPAVRGIANYDIYVSVDGGEYFLLLDDTLETSWAVTVERGRTYAFYSVATDNVGHVEPAPYEPDAIITISETPDEVIITGPTDLIPGVLYSYNFSVLDALLTGENEELTYQIDWTGDGVVDEEVPGPAAGITVEHIFPYFGAFAITALAADPEGPTGSPGTLDVTVAAAAMLGDDLHVGGTPGK